MHTLANFALLLIYSKRVIYDLFNRKIYERLSIFVISEKLVKAQSCFKPIGIHYEHVTLL